MMSPLNSRDLAALSVLGVAIASLVLGAVAYIRLWGEVRPELRIGDSHEATHYRTIASSGPTSGALYDFLDNIWTPAGRRLRRRTVAFTAAGVLLLWAAMAHWFGRW